MAGSYRHVTTTLKAEPNVRQFIGPILLDHLGDATEALEELWFMVHYLAKDDLSTIDAAISEFNRPTSSLANELLRRLKMAKESGYWEGRLSEVSESK